MHAAFKGLFQLPCGRHLYYDINEGDAECGERKMATNAHMKYPAYLLLTFRVGRLGVGLYKLLSSHHVCRFNPSVTRCVQA